MVVGGAGSVASSVAGVAVLLDALGTLIRDSCESRLTVLIAALVASIRDSQGLSGGSSCMSLLGGMSCASASSWCSVTMLHR